MPPVGYRPRVIDGPLALDLEALGAVVVEGPRACGKTWTAAQLARSEVRLDSGPQVRELARLQPESVLAGPTPRLVDEWQLVPSLWNAVRRQVDDRAGVGQFILTGSAVVPAETDRHSGAGRMARLRMRPMSLWESGESTGQVSLAALFAHEPPSGRSGVLALDYVELSQRGGWPALLGAGQRHADRFVAGYLDAIVEHDIEQVDDRRRDPLRFRRFLHAYAQMTAQTASLSSIRTRIEDPTSTATGLAWNTADAYLDAAQRLMIVEEVPAWSPRLRSRTRLAGLAKRHFVDPSLSVSLLGASAARLRSDLETFGFIFESMVTRDLRVYADALDASVHHYRERSGDLEVDLVVERRDGAWIGIEVKLGQHRVDEAATALHALADRRVARPPEALVVITGGEYAYRREDGVDVVPLATLCP
ncbi:ATP-binding protein [Cellulomonas hominis]